MAIREQIRFTARDDTRAAMLSLQRGLSGLERNVATLTRGLFFLGGGAGFGIAVRRSLEFADAIGKTADKVGVGVEALQELRFAARQNGVEQRALDLGLQRFSRRVGEAVQGQGELVKVIRQYGIALTDAQGRTRATEAILRDYADVVAAARSPQEQLRLAFKAFDSEGAALVNLLRQGGDALDSYSQKARNLGIVLDERLVRNAEQANDKLRDLTDVLQVKFATGVTENAESIIRLADALITAANASTKFVSDFGEALGFLAFRSTGQTDSMEERLLALRENLKFFEDRGITAAAAATRAEIEALEQTIAEFNAGIVTPQRSTRTPAEILPSPEAVREEAKESYAPAVEERVQMWLDIHEVDREAYEEALAAAEASTAAAAAAFGAQAEVAGEAFEQMSVFAEQAGRNMQDALAQFLFDPFEDGLDGMLRSFVDTLRQMAAQAAAAQIFGSLAGIGGPIGSFFGFLTGKRAEGGPVTGGGAYLVGERGPEIFVPQHSGNIIPNNRMGGDLVLNVDARQSTDPTAIFEVVKVAGAQLKREIAREMNRGTFR